EENAATACYCIADLSKYHDGKKIVYKSIEEFGDLHILVNNAGIDKPKMMHKMSIDDWNLVLNINLTGQFNCSQPAVVYMREKNYGRIINIASAGWEGNIGQANYAAAKAGVIGLSKTIAKENAKKGITCNIICPGFIDTPMTRGIPEDRWNDMMNKIPMGYAGKPEDVGYMIAFLASDEAKYITGEIFNVGGGFRI
ncbi:MAG: SDR family NAD(P)-dependent oxidoreductase, partial [Oscillospiraceae bacterium]